MEEIRKVSNDNVSLKDLQKRLNKVTVGTDYNFIIEEEKNKKTSLRYNIRVYGKNNDICICIKSFFDKVDILYYLKGLEEMEVLKKWEIKMY